MATGSLLIQEAVPKFSSASLLRRVHICLEFFHPAFDQAACWWQVEGDEGHAKRKHPKTEYRQEAEHATHHKQEANKTAHHWRQAVPRPTQHPIAESADSALQVAGLFSHTNAASSLADCHT